NRERDAHSRRDRKPASRIAQLGGQEEPREAQSALRGGRRVRTERAHPRSGLRTHADELTSKRFAIAPSGEGGRRLTVSRPPSTPTSTRSLAHPGRALRTAGPAGRPAARAIAPASLAPSASVSE